jgi:hypothetical protein
MNLYKGRHRAFKSHANRPPFFEASFKISNSLRLVGDLDYLYDFKKYTIIFSGFWFLEQNLQFSPNQITALGCGAFFAVKNYIKKEQNQ